jgi:hypothetical protein
MAGQGDHVNVDAITAFGKIKALPTSTRTQALLLFVVYVWQGAGRLADFVAGLVANGANAELRAEMATSIACWAIAGGALVFSCYIISEGLRPIVPKKRPPTE